MEATHDSADLVSEVASPPDSGADVKDQRRAGELAS